MWRKAVVCERRNETADTVAFTLTSSDGSELPNFVPGQYVQSEFIFPTGPVRFDSTYQRAHPARRVFAPTGEVSKYLYDNVFEGDVLDVTTPFGDVVLPDDDAPLLLISAGIGCTPTAPPVPTRTAHS